MIRLILVLGCAALAAPSLAAPAKKVMAFYYTWYGLPQFQNRWVHWDEGGHDPSKLDGRGYPDIGATDHPIELYDSNDPSTVRKHLKLAESAGIDVLISTWWHRDDYHDRAFKVLIREAEGAKVATTVYYETAKGGPQGGNPLDKVVEDFNYILDNYATSSAFFKHQGAPVIFVYGRALGQMTREQWKEALARIRSKRPLFVVGDSLDPAWLEVFDAIHEYNTLWQPLTKADMVSEARKYVHMARSANRIATVTVIPGYDDSHIGRVAPVVVSRRGGDLYKEMWAAAVRAKPDWVIICSFNEWHEGSEIEPSREYGSLFIDLTEKYARAFKEIPDRRVTAADDLVFTAQERKAKELLVSNLDKRAGRFRISALKPRDALILEVGRASYAFGWVNVEPAGDGCAFDARPWTDYQVWSRKAYALKILASTENILGLKAGSADLAERLTRAYQALNAGRLGKEPGLAGLKLMIAQAAAAHYGINVSLHMDYEAASPRTYNIFVGREFPFVLMISNLGRKNLGVRPLKISGPDNWTILQPDQRNFQILRSGDRFAWTGRMLTRRATRELPYPLIVWFEILDGKAAFKSQVSCVVEVIHPFTTELAVKSISPTELQADLTFRNNFPGIAHKGIQMELSLPKNWQGRPDRFTMDLSNVRTVNYRIKRPEWEEPALRQVGIIYRLGRDYVSSKRFNAVLAVRLGESGRGEGLSQVRPEDGQTETVEVGGRICRRSIPVGGAGVSYIYLDVSSNLPPAGGVAVTVEYFDQGTRAFNLQYDSTDPIGGIAAAYKETAEVWRSGSNTWKTETFVLQDARFSGAQNGQADFRIAAFGDPICVSRIIVSKFLPDVD